MDSNPIDEPFDLVAEKAILSSVLYTPDAITHLTHLLAAMFSPEHRLIWQAMLDLAARRTPPDLITVTAELRSRGHLERIGGADYLAELSDRNVTWGYVLHYAKVVTDLAYKQHLLDVSRQVARLAQSDKDTDTLRSDMLGLLTTATAQPDRASLTTLSEAMEALTAALMTDQPPALSTGLHDLDELIYGLRRGRLITVAGRPSHGKTALALTIACNVSQHGHAGLIFSMEMETEELAQRILSMQSGIDGKTVQSLTLGPPELRQALATIRRVGTWPIFIRAGAVTLNDIRTLTLRHIAEHGPLAYIVVDYLGLVTPSGKKGQNRAQEVGEISRGLKQLASEAGCDVFMLSQMNRAIEGRNDPTPTLADLRETGDIEQDSNVVLFVVNPEMFDKQTKDKGIGLVYVEKHRGGKRGLVRLTFRAELTRFDNFTGRTPEGY
jgi:replicative DNA helicase